MQSPSFIYPNKMIQYLANKLRKRIELPENVDSFLVKSFPTVFFLPCMSYKETKLLEKHSKHCKNVVEFGSGGSTIYFLKENKKVLSIENNKPYVNYIYSFDFIKKKIAENQLILCYIDTGEVRKWGKPINDYNKEDWPQYYESIWDKHNFENPDLVFIDGRFRVMCALSALPHITPKTTVFFHDFTKPKKYNSILEFFDVVDYVDSLYALKVKLKIDKEKLEHMKREFHYDYR